MNFRTPVGRSTTELQETRGSLDHITSFNSFLSTYLELLWAFASLQTVSGSNKWKFNLRIKACSYKNFFVVETLCSY